MYKSRPFFRDTQESSGWTLKELAKDDYVKNNCPKKATKHVIYIILFENGQITELIEDPVDEVTNDEDPVDEVTNDEDPVDEVTNGQITELIEDVLDPVDATVPTTVSSSSSENKDIILHCVKHKGKLRVRVVGHPHYHPHINCQFPRNLRREGRFFKVTSLKIAHGPNGTIFYRANPKDIREMDGEPDIQIKVYQEEDVSECIICFSNEKDVVFVPCGHFYSCGDCYNQFKKKECPICRGPIKTILQSADLKLDN